MKFSKFIFGSLLFAIAFNAFGQDNEPPSVPTNVAADSITETSIEISWNRSTDNGKVADYLVYVNNAAEGITIDTSYLILNLIPDSTYSLWVTARDTSSNVSGASTPVLQITLPSDTMPPSIPGNLVSTMITQDTIVIAWDAAIDSVGVFDYFIYVDGVLTDSTHTTSDTVPNLNPGTLYGLSVAARDSALNVSLPSDILELTTLDDSEAPTAPSGLADIAINTTSISISWSASTDNVGVTEYGIFVNGVEIDQTNLPNYLLYDLGPEADYSIYVRARDAASNESESSDTLALTTLSDTEAPTVPSGLLSSAVTTTSFDISWTASTDDVGVADYFIFIDGVLKDSSEINSYSILGLEPATTYTITVSARDTSNNQSAESVALVDTTNTIADNEAPSIPNGLIDRSITASSIEVSWNPSSDNVGVLDYLVYKGGVQEDVTTDTNYTFSSLLPNTAYIITVRARDTSDNESELSAALPVTTGSDAESPTTPTNLSTIVRTSNRINFSWTASTDNIGVVDYIVYVGGVELDTVASIGYALTDLSPETEYSITVSARDAAGNISSESSALIESTLEYIDVEAPTPPSALIAGAVTTTSIGISWGASTDNIGVADYLVFMNGTQVAVISGLTYTAENLSPLTTYNFYILGRDTAGNTSEPSTSLGISTLVDSEKPTPPTSLLSDNISVNTVDISWATSTDNIGVVDYMVYVNGALLSTLAGTSLSLLELDPDTQYEIYVAARDAAGNISIPSNLLTISTLSDTDAPTVPSDLSAYGLSEFSIRLNWNASTDNIAVVSYLIFQDGNQIGAATQITYTATGLEPESEHSYYVIAVDAAGNKSVASNTVTGTTLSEPDIEDPTAPSALSLNSMTHTSLDLFWIASMDNVGVEEYAIFLNGIEVDTTQTTNYIALNLIPETEYEVYVMARDAAGNSSLASNYLIVKTKAQPDIEAPSIPQNISVADTGYTSITLSWEPSTDNDGIEAYLIYKEGILVDLSDTSSYLAENLLPFVEYNYFIAARDSSGNISEASIIFAFMITDPGPDVIPPKAPSLHQTVDSTDNSIRIMWTEAYDFNGVSTYWVYVSDVLSLITADTSAIIEGLHPNVEYSIYIIASDEAGNFSEKSNTVLALTTGPNAISYAKRNQQEILVISLGTEHGIKVVLPEPKEKLDLRIVDLQGRVVLMDQIYPFGSEVLINKNFKPGVYFIQLFDGYQVFTKSFAISN